MLFKKQYLTWREQVIQDLVLTSVLALGERVLERILLSGLHRTVGRMVTPDPSRVDSMTVVIAEAFGLFVFMWLFILILYAISYLTRRPLKSYATAIVVGFLTTIIFIASMAEWFRMPNPPG